MSGNWVAMLEVDARDVRKGLAYIISVYDMSKTGGGQWERAPAPIRRKNDTPLTYGDDSTHLHPIAIHYRRIHNDHYHVTSFFFHIKGEEMRKIYKRPQTPKP